MTAIVPRHFAEYGDDFLWCFSSIAATSSDRDVANLALRMGQERARQWRLEHPSVPENASATKIMVLISGSYAADRLGVVDHRIRQDLIRAAGRYRAEDYFDFDPTKEPPPADVPEQCGKCRTYNRRGVRVCQECGSALTMSSRYSVLLDALLALYTGERYGVRLGGALEDATQWVPQFRPYRGREAGRDEDWSDLTYLITHLIYTLNGYGQFRLQPEWLPDEWAFLRANLKEAIAMDDPETAGEFLDTLKSFGMSERDPSIRTGMEFLLSRQNPDGSWGEPGAADPYARYHPTWTAIDGLRDYAWQGERVTSPEALRRAQPPSVR
jgi:hypothetical protein